MITMDLSSFRDHFQIENHGTILLVRPLTDDAAEWLEYSAPEDAQFIGAAMAVEPRYLMGVIQAWANRETND